MLPALYGCLFLSQMTSKAGGTVIQGKIKAEVLPGILVFVIHMFVTPANRGLISDSPSLTAVLSHIPWFPAAPSPPPGAGEDTAGR